MVVLSHTIKAIVLSGIVSGFVLAVVEIASGASGASGASEFWVPIWVSTEIVSLLMVELSLVAKLAAVIMIMICMWGYQPAIVYMAVDCLSIPTHVQRMPGRLTGYRWLWHAMVCALNCCCQLWYFDSSYSGVAWICCVVILINRDLTYLR
jgi:hypothetical protein